MSLRLDLSAQTYLPFVHVVSPRSDLRFDDNYFDLAAGETRTIVIHADAPLSVDDVQVRWWRHREPPVSPA